MNTIIERITEAIKEILISFITSGLGDMFTAVNEKVGTVAEQVGQTPQGWNSGVFSLIQNLSQTVMIPIAGMIITFVLCYELITMVTQKNNFHDSVLCRGRLLPFNKIWQLAYLWRIMTTERKRGTNGTYLYENRGLLFPRPCIAGGKPGDWILGKTTQGLSEKS
jgi:hypothetical protein